MSAGSASASGSGSVPLIGITGATGQLGRLVVSELKKVIPSESIVALVRSPSKVGELKFGVSAVEADYTKPNTLVKALEGVHTLLLISSSTIDHDQRVVEEENVIEAAKKTGVKHIVYTSLVSADKSPLSLAKGSAATEATLKESGIHYTILRNGWYNENYIASIPGALATGTWIGASGEGKISVAARIDYADAAVAVLANPAAHVDKIYELGGDETVTGALLAAELSKQTGKKITYQNLSVDEYIGILVEAGIPKPYAHLIAESDFDARNDALFDNSRTLSTLIGRPTTPLATTFAEALQVKV